MASHSVARHERRRVAVLCAAGILLGGIVMPWILTMVDVGTTGAPVTGAIDAGEMAIAIAVLIAGCGLWGARWPRRVARHRWTPVILQGVSITVGIVAVTVITAGVPWLSVTVLFGGVFTQALVYCWRWAGAE